MKVLVLLGGASNERAVSIRSGQSIIAALEQAGHEAVKYDPAEGYEGLAGYVGKVDCVFPILHGQGGEDGQIQAELERLKFKYLGATPIVSKNCFNKEHFKTELEKLKISTPRWEIVNAQSIKASDLIHSPYVLKPIEGGSSIDTQIIRDISKSYDGKVFERYERMLLEELIDGSEITVGVLGSKALPVVEIIPPSGQEFNYDNKYNGASQEICPPQNIDRQVQKESQALAEQLQAEFGIRHLLRADFMIGSRNKLYAIDLNTMPGLTAQSLFPKAAAAAGLNMSELAQCFVELAIE